MNEVFDVVGGGLYDGLFAIEPGEYGVVRLHSNGSVEVIIAVF